MRTANRILMTVAGIALLAGPVGAKTTALVGGTVHTVTGPSIENATVIVTDGRIAAVGAGVNVPAGAERIDVSGLHVYPGMIAAHTILGLNEISSVRGTRDYQETGEINPNARAVVALNADSEVAPTVRANGVLTVQTVTVGGTITGTSVVWNLDGWNWEDMALLPEAGLHVRWPQSVASSSWWNRQTPEEVKKDREKKTQALREAFDDARAYHKARRAMAAGGPHHETDVRWEAMIPVLEGKRRVFIHADEVQQIEGALDFAQEQELDIAIVGGRDAWRVADRLAAEGVPVIVDNVFQTPRRSWEPYDAAYTVAEKLRAAGVEYCISVGGTRSTFAQTRNLPYHAAMAAAHGLPRDEALKSVTLYPARILGLGDRLGSIEVGKDANLIVTDGDPLEIMTRVRHAFVAGNAVDLDSRHTRLYDKYRHRPRTDGNESRLEPAR